VQEMTEPDRLLRLRVTFDVWSAGPIGMVKVSTWLAVPTEASIVAFEFVLPAIRRYTAPSSRSSLLAPR
jgi:hypothetical protein